MKRFAFAMLALCLVLGTAQFAHAFTTLTVTATWTNPTADATHGAPTGARLERQQDALAYVTACTVGSGVTTCTDTAQPIGHSYNYRVISTNSFGDAAASNVATVAAFVPGAASGLTLTWTLQ
jgi:hypothetical protein